MAKVSETADWVQPRSWSALAVGAPVRIKWWDGWRDGEIVEVATSAAVAALTGHAKGSIAIEKLASLQIRNPKLVAVNQ